MMAEHTGKASADSENGWIHSYTTYCAEPGDNEFLVMYQMQSLAW
jgi:chlorite dismutase